MVTENTTRWGVLKYVAERYGPHQSEIYGKRAEKLARFREGTLPITALEEDQERIRKRLLREPGNRRLERLIGSNDFQDKHVLDQLINVAQGVCRISLNGSPIGTGFLVAENIILTNHHVIASPQDAVGMTAEFDYELDYNGSLKTAVTFKLNANVFFLTSSVETDPAVPHSGLDFTFIGLDAAPAALARFKPVHLDGNAGKIIKGESCVLIQHPNGLPKKVVLKNNLLFSETNTRMVYEADSLPGSSGAPVVALGTGEVFALHHSGYPRTDEHNNILTISGAIADEYTPDNEIDWLGNEGIKISRIILAVLDAQLPPQMEAGRKALLARTEQNALQFGGPPLTTHFTSNKTDEKATAPETPVAPPHNTSNNMEMTDFLLVAKFSPSVIQRIESLLSQRHNRQIQLRLVMPNCRVENELELFAVTLPVSSNDAHTVARELGMLPGILVAEADLPLYFDCHHQFSTSQTSGLKKEESDERIEIWQDGLSKHNEFEFEEEFIDKRKSPYLKKGDKLRNRRWNWEATNFHKLKNVPSADEINAIRIVQFDTGYTDHPKLEGGIDFDLDRNVIKRTTNALDDYNAGILKFPGHGTRTGSILIGNVTNGCDHDGNEGLLNPFGYKLTPYRIAETVILINRQRELGEALNLVLHERIFDIITMSMGLPPTISTAHMARRAYERGIIWCCAAGNEVQAVVAPAVYPGTIAVAASNPLDERWKGSSRGDTVDITAPGEAVYIPILNNDENPDFAYGDGTSFAAPHVAAAAALWLARYSKELAKRNYVEWKRVEAFRWALKQSARTQHRLPRGFGAGILDVSKLLDTPPPIDEKKLKYAYEGQSDAAFLQSLGAWSEAVKTYWNNITGRSSWSSRRSRESVSIMTPPVSPFTQELERALFASSANRPVLSEANIQPDRIDTLERFNMIHAELFPSLNK